MKSLILFLSFSLLVLCQELTPEEKLEMDRILGKKEEDILTSSELINFLKLETKKNELTSNEENFCWMKYQEKMGIVYLTRFKLSSQEDPCIFGSDMFDECILKDGNHIQTAKPGDCKIY